MFDILDYYVSRKPEFSENGFKIIKFELTNYGGYCNRDGPYFNKSDDCVMLGRYNDNYNYDGICMCCLDLFEEILVRAYE